MAGKPLCSWIRAAVLVGCVAALSATISSGQEPISVRAGTGFRYHLSRTAGEQQLAALSSAAAVEDAWVLVGDTWMDVGFQEERTSVRVDVEAVAEALRSQDPAAPRAFYHIHPFHQDPSIIEPPSLQDVHSLALMKEACSGRAGARMIGIIFDGRGEWTFDLMDDLGDRVLGKEYAPLSGGDGYAARHGYGDRPGSAFHFDREYPLLSWNAALPGAASSRSGRIMRFITDARRLGVIVDYAPIEP